MKIFDKKPIKLEAKIKPLCLDKKLYCTQFKVIHVASSMVEFYYTTLFKFVYGCLLFDNLPATINYSRYSKNINVLEMPLFKWNLQSIRRNLVQFACDRIRTNKE